MDGLTLLSIAVSLITLLLVYGLGLLRKFIGLLEDWNDTQDVEIRALKGRNLDLEKRIKAFEEKAREEGHGTH